jgi:hypothetical protein
MIIADRLRRCEQRRIDDSKRATNHRLLLFLVGTLAVAPESMTALAAESRRLISSQPI